MDKVVKEDLVNVDDITGGSDIVYVSVKDYVNEDKMPTDYYFKGYITFTLWGYIPPPGGEKYKIYLIAAVNDKKVKMDNNDDQAAMKKEFNDDTNYIRELEARGTTTSLAEETKNFASITDIMVKGRQEMQK